MGAASPAATRKLFGTDGVRGVAGEFITAELALGLARAATARVDAKRVLIIRDTRESGEMLEAAVAAGIAAAGGEALLGGVLPTPGAPLLIGRYGFDLGVVLSASHNPFADNGIKFFGGDGYKLSDAVEAGDRGAARVAAAQHAPRPRPPLPRRARGLPARAARALRRPRPQRPPRAAGLRQRRDLRGRAGDLPPPRRPRRRDGRAPDGRNINAGCGSTHLEPLAGGDGRGRLRLRLRLRRRRRSRAGRRPQRHRGRRRRADRARRHAQGRAAASR